MTQLKDKIALITGGTTGIGLATAKLFRDQGATVIVTGRSDDTLQAARAELGEAVSVIKSDAGNPEEIKQLFETIARKHDRLDVFFANAGIARFAPIAKFDQETFADVFRINFQGPFLALQAALPLLKRGSSVLFTTSVTDRLGFAGSSVYAASKAALRSLVRTASTELSAQGIRINAISPGPIETPIYGKLGLSEAEVAGFAESIVGRVPLGRFGRSEEVANAALFLASDASSFIQGIELEIDGGMAQV